MSTKPSIESSNTTIQPITLAERLKLLQDTEVNKLKEENKRINDIINEVIKNMHRINPKDPEKVTIIKRIKEIRTGLQESPNDMDTS